MYLDIRYWYNILWNFLYYTKNKLYIFQFDTPICRTQIQTWHNLTFFLGVEYINQSMFVGHLQIFGVQLRVEIHSPGMFPNQVGSPSRLVWKPYVSRWNGPGQGESGKYFQWSFVFMVIEVPIEIMNLCYVF